MKRVLYLFFLDTQYKPRIFSLQLASQLASLQNNISNNMTFFSLSFPALSIDIAIMPTRFQYFKKFKNQCFISSKCLLTLQCNKKCIYYLCLKNSWHFFIDGICLQQVRLVMLLWVLLLSICKGHSYEILKEVLKNVQLLQKNYIQICYTSPKVSQLANFSACCHHN